MTCSTNHEKGGETMKASKQQVKRWLDENAQVRLKAHWLIDGNTDRKELIIGVPEVDDRLIEIMRDAEEKIQFLLEQWANA